MNENIQKNTYSRILSIDRLRGFAVFVMVLFQLSKNFDNFKILSRISVHSPNSEAIYLLPNFALADTNVSVFLLAIGLTYVLSFNKRVKLLGRKKATTHFITRYLSITGTGILLHGIEAALNGTFNLYSYFVLSMLMLLAFLYVFSWVCKKSKREKEYNILKRSICIIFSCSGIVGIIVAAINFIFLCMGKTNTSFNYCATLEHIGAAGILALPFVAFSKLNSTSKRFAAGFVLLLIYGVFHQSDLPTDYFPNNMLLLDVVADGGFFAVLAWGAQLLIFTCFADLYYKSRKSYIYGVLIFSIPVIGIIAEMLYKAPKNIESWAGLCNSFLSVNKGSVSPSYIMLTTWICLLIFLIFDLFNKFNFKFDFLTWWGKNPLVMYLLDFLVVGGLCMIFEGHFAYVPSVIGFLECLAIMSAMTFIAYKMDRKQKIYKF